MVFVRRDEAPGAADARLDGPAFLEAEALALPLDERRLLLNPGSVGQPRDGDPRASALVLDIAARRATWHRVAYPIATTQAAMRAAALPAGLVTPRTLDGAELPARLKATTW